MELISHHHDAIRPNFEAHPWRCAQTSATGFEPVATELLWLGNVYHPYKYDGVSAAEFRNK